MRFKALAIFSLIMFGIVSCNKDTPVSPASASDTPPPAAASAPGLSDAAWATSFKLFAQRFIDRLKRRDVPETFTFDLNKTESLISPIVGVISYKRYRTLNSGVSPELETEDIYTFVPEEGKWKLKNATEIDVSTDNSTAGRRTEVYLPEKDIQEMADAVQGNDALTQPKP